MNIRPFKPEDLPEMTRIWNQVVQEGMALPQEETLDEETAATFFKGQTVAAVAEENGKIPGLYILYSKNVGRCGHSANAFFAVEQNMRGRGIGRALAEDCIKRARQHGFRLLQFNPVVASNHRAIHLYESLGFQWLGVLPGGFRDKNGIYQNTISFYRTLE